MNKSFSRALVVLVFGGIFFTCTKNQVPEIISISGPDESLLGQADTFSITGTDPDEDSLAYLVKWGDGDSAGWSAYFASGDSIQFTHTYATDSFYSILALAKDVNGDTSPWSEPHTIAILLEIPKKWEFVNSPGTSPFTTPPAIGDNGTVYFIVNEMLFAIDSGSTESWSYNLGATSSSSPSIGDDGTIYAGVSNGQFTAVYPNGSLDWTYPAAYPTGGAIGSDGTIYFGSKDSCLYALDPDGNLAWFYKGFGSINNTPIIGQSGNIYFGTENGYLYAIAPDGDSIWTLKLSSSFCCPGAIDDDETIYTLTANALSAVNSDGSIAWTCSFQNLSTSNTPVIGINGTIYMGDGTNLYAISPNGTILWSSIKNCHTTPAITQNNYIVAPIATGTGVEVPHEIYKLDLSGIPKARSRDLLWAEQAVAIADNGTIYASGASITFGYAYLFALEANSPLASSSWPMYQHDARHTGRAGP